MRVSGWWAVLAVQLLVYRHCHTTPREGLLSDARGLTAQSALGWPYGFRRSSIGKRRFGGCGCGRGVWLVARTRCCRVKAHGCASSMYLSTSIKINLNYSISGSTNTNNAPPMEGRVRVLESECGGQRCLICLSADTNEQDERPIQGGCACRGDSGTAHVQVTLHRSKLPLAFQDIIAYASASCVVHAIATTHACGVLYYAGRALPRFKGHTRVRIRAN